MFIPLHDSNSLKYIRLQYVTLGLIAANVCIFFLMTLSGDSGFYEAAVLGLGYIPAVDHNLAVLPEGSAIVPDDLTYLTYSFLHGDIFHLGGNMLFLWVFGDNVEDAFGHIKFLIFYLLCAAAGAFFHGFLLPDSEQPLIGASGAIAGVVAAYLILHPRVRVWVLAFGRIPLRIPAVIPLAIWIALQFVMLFLSFEEQISWAAHVGGILAGSVLVFILKRRGVPLFDRTMVTPQAVMIDREPSAAELQKVPPTRWGRSAK